MALSEVTAPTANSAVTGGTINNTPIGNTVPASGVFTSVATAYVTNNRGVSTDMQMRLSDVTRAVFNYNTFDALSIDFAGNVTAIGSFNIGAGIATPDVRLFRDAANTLAQRNGTAAQAFNIYNTYTDAANYERGFLDWSTNPNFLTLGTSASGTGVVRQIVFKIGAANTLIFGPNYMQPASNAVYDLGGPSNNYRNIYSVGQNLAGNGTAAAPSYSFGAAPGTGITGNGSSLTFILSGVPYASLNSSNLNVPALAVGYSGTFLYGDAANTLAQRNGTAAQAFNVYNTFTDAANYERGVFDWISNPNILTIGTISAGTGGGRPVRFVVANSSVFDIGTTVIQPVFNGAVALGAGNLGWKKLYLDYTNTVTVGAVTINKAAGRVNIAAAGTSIVVTNSFVTAASKVFAQVSQADGTAYIKNVVPAAGSFTINLGAAATAQTSVDFFVVNAD